jgi:hypothetical protein
MSDTTFEMPLVVYWHGLVSHSKAFHTTSVLVHMHEHKQHLLHKHVCTCTRYLGSAFGWQGRFYLLLANIVKTRLLQ